MMFSFAALVRVRLKIGEVLPQIKHTAKQYKVSEQTVTTAYKFLCNNQYAYKVGKSYWVGAPESSTTISSSEIYIRLSPVR